MRHIALILLIVSLLAALQSDAQDVEPPRRLDPPATATPLEENAEAKSGKNETPDSASLKVDDVTKLPFSFTPADNAPVPAEGRPPEAIQLFHCDFGPAWDRDFDNWPDRWSREQSVNYPHYVKIRIVDDALPKTSDENASSSSAKTPNAIGDGSNVSEDLSNADENASNVKATESGARCLQVDLDGGAAAVHCPPVKVDAMYTYVVEGRVQTKGLKHDEAFLSLTFLDAANKPLQTIRSDGLRRTTDWTKVRIGPIAATNKQAHSAVITLHLSRTEKADLNGT